MKEEYFVTTYVRKAKQERLLYELSHKEKRYRALDRFCHSADSLLNREKVVLKGNNLLYSDSFNRFIQGQHEPCLVLSPDPSVDGQTLSAKDAIAAALGTLDACIVFNSRFAYVQSEAMASATDRWLLMANPKDDPESPIIY